MLIQRLEETRAALVETDAGEVIAGDVVLVWIDSWGTPDENAAEREPPH